jgi:hypothetical protein
MSEAQINLKVNDLYVETINRGEPLILTVQVSYPGNMEDEQENRIIDIELEELETRLDEGETTEEEYKEEKERLEAQKKEIETPSLGTEAEPWTDAVRFQVLVNDEWSPLDWKLEFLTTNSPDPILELRSDTIAVARYAVAPEDVEDISEGAHRVKAVTSDAESNPVAVGVSREEDTSPSPTKLENNVGYFMLKGAFDQALTLIQGMLVSDPRSVLGMMFMGDLQRAMGNIREALQTYEKARGEFVAQDPDFWEPPRAIDAKIAEITELVREEEES